MRVAQVIYSLHPGMGGLPKSAAAIAASLTESGVESALIFFSTVSGLAETKKAFGSCPGFENVKLYPLPPGRLKYLYSSAVSAALEDFSPDLIHTHGLWEPLLAHAQRFALRKKIPYVVMPHSMLHPWQSRHHRFAKWGLKYVLCWKDRWRQSAFVQVLNDAEARHVRAEGIEQTRMIPNGIFESEDPGQSPERPSGFPDGSFVLFLARLHAQKAPDLLLRAFALLQKDLHLVFAGPDYGMEVTVKKLARSLGCADRVYFPGMLEGEQKWAALHHCSCFCLPSRAEGFSMAVLEAAQAGAQIVITPECAFEDLAEAGGALIAELTPESLATSIDQALSDEGAMGSSAHEFVCTHYVWKDIAGRLAEAYREVCT